MSTTDIWSRKEVVAYLRLLAKTRQVKECAHLLVERGEHGAFYPRCTENCARRVLAYNVVTDSSGKTAPTSYCWLRCPTDCPSFERAQEFLPAAGEEDEENLLSGNELGEIASAIALRDREPRFSAAEWKEEPASPAVAEEPVESEPSITLEPPAAAAAPSFSLVLEQDDYPPFETANARHEEDVSVPEHADMNEDQPGGQASRRWLTAAVAAAAFLVGVVAGQAEFVRQILHVLASLGH